jgi:hypothetical protein
MTTEIENQLYCPLANTDHEIYCKNFLNNPKFRPFGVLCSHAAHCYGLKIKLNSYDIRMIPKIDNKEENDK